MKDEAHRVSFFFFFFPIPCQEESTRVRRGSPHSEKDNHANEKGSRPWDRTLERVVIYGVANQLNSPVLSIKYPTDSSDCVNLIFVKVDGTYLNNDNSEVILIGNACK